MKPEDVVQKMYDGDAFSQWLGIKRLTVGEGISTLQMQIRDEMTNGFGIAHGGISYSLADSALAFASNSYGIQSVSIETSISHTKAIHAGDVITARAEEKSRSNKIAVYDIPVTNQKEEVVALFKGTVYRTGKEWA